MAKALTSADMDSARVQHVAEAESRSYKESTQLAVPALADYVLGVAGQRLSAVSLGLKDARQLRAWQGGTQIRQDQVEARLRLLYRVAKTVASVYDEATARAFLRSSSPYLGDHAPIMQIAADDEANVVRAVRSFLEG